MIPPTTNSLRLDVWIGAVLALIGAATACGWLLHLPLLVQVVPGLVPMVFNTGLGFLGIGVSLALGSRRSPAAQFTRTAISIAVVMLCTATIVELAIDRPLGIDFASLHAWFDYGNTRPGRMAPNTALGFILAGMALLLADRVRSRASAIAVLGLTFGLLAIGLTGLVGYLLAPDLLFGWARSARMAVHTASSMILAAFGIWWSWSRQPWYLGESHFRDDTKIRLLSAVIVIVVTITAGLTGFVLQQHSFEQALESRLEAVVQGRIPRFAETARKYQEHASADVTLTGIALSAERWLAAPADEARRSAFAQDAARLLGAHYRSVAIQRADGSVAAHFGETGPDAPFHVSIGGAESIELVWDGQTVLRTRHVVSRSGDILTLDQLAPELLRSLVDTAGLGASAHVAACVRQGAKLLCLPDSRNSSLYTVVPRGGVSPLPMERALAGGRGTAHGVDYRGHNVVAAVGLLASGFGLIAKEDTLDAYAPIRMALGQGVPIILVVTLLGGILMTWQLAPLVARLRRSEQLASEASAKNAAIMHAAGDAIVTIDHLGHMLAVNDAAHRIFGYADGELAGRKVAMLMPEASRAAHEHGLARVVAGGTPRLVGVSNVQVRGLRSDGCEFPLELTLSAVPLPDNMLFVGVMRDITERRAMEDKLSHMAQFDSLTGLPNRALFMDRLDTAMTRAGRSHRALAVMFLDLDGFKAINDTLGHRAGDDVLVQIAERLASAVRRSDTVARLGGDEFTILLEELVDPDADAHAIADKVLAALRSPLRAGGQPLSVTTSIGLVVHKSDSLSATPSELLSHADGAMYAAKRAGKDAYRTFVNA